MLGGLWGSLVGDALGVPVEFQNRDTRRIDPVIGMRGYGIHNQPPGTWSDDGALLLCSAESLMEKGFDLNDMGARFIRWYEDGYWGAHGEVFDIGNTTAAALTRICDELPAEQAGGRDLYDNGNGSLMRILPVALASLSEADAVFVDRICRSSSNTHGHARSQSACVFHGFVARELMRAQPAQQAMSNAVARFKAIYENHSESGAFRELLSRDIASMHETEIRSGGYVMETLTASLWCLLTTDTFADCVLKAVNLGSDTDTTGCVAGGLAGLYYGVASIPDEWLQALPRQTEVESLLSFFVAKHTL